MYLVLFRLIIIMRRTQRSQEAIGPPVGGLVQLTLERLDFLLWSV